MTVQTDMAITPEILSSEKAEPGQTWPVGVVVCQLRQAVKDKLLGH